MYSQSSNKRIYTKKNISVFIPLFYNIIFDLLISYFDLHERQLFFSCLSFRATAGEWKSTKIIDPLLAILYPEQKTVQGLCFSHALLHCMKRCQPLLPSEHVIFLLSCNTENTYILKCWHDNICLTRINGIILQYYYIVQEPSLFFLISDKNTYKPPRLDK